jgi:lipopolysaccharide biosynthesis protein
MLSDPESDMPFCLCWANENWTRRWDAAEHEVLIAQKYLPQDDLKFIESLVPFFLDPRYIKLNGAPFFIVYRPQHLPDAKKTVSIWRDYCKSMGFESIHICAALTHGNEDYNQFGFDSGVEFPPHNLRTDPITNLIAFEEPFRGNVLQFEAVAQSYIERRYSQKNVFRSVFPSWDNTARTRHRALIVLNGTPANYEYWLHMAIKKTIEDFPNEQRFVFINAWNEWAEGCHLEPDQKFNGGFLEATLRVKLGSSPYRTFTDFGLPSSFRGQQRTLWGDIRNVTRYHTYMFFGRMRAWLKRHPRVRNAARRVLARRG